MGRGRQKAKHTKVARELKYYSPATDYRALEEELSGQGHQTDVVTDSRWDVTEDEDDDWQSSYSN
ncbi:DUF3073 domain-containing protein [Rarobacter faecitabidus]|uniref:DUF3073 family protein n=1 Tax=Rarobacter faecitabidus TaxID=13243 RepID=A0A542ZE58_RARFA|nr:DUF3073 domain-containing protein [Rarobacter faecitabidus]TQL58597.1 DUF3073 family protein [Rarobacter faecitabidus]